MKQLVAFAAGLILLLLVVGLIYGGKPVGGCVGVIRVEGELFSSGGGVLGGGASAREVVGWLEEARSDAGVKSVLLTVNSPGGSAAASKEVFEAVRRLDKPSVAFLGEVAASGGYHVASATDWVVANPNALTGSIGARATFLNYRQLFEKLGLREETVKSGALKDMLSGYKDVSDEERLILSQLINESFDNLVSDIRTARGEKVENAFFRQALDARLLSAKQALKAGLVDELGVERKALEKAVVLGNVSSVGDVCVFESKRTLADLINVFGASIGRGAATALGSAPKLEFS